MVMMCLTVSCCQPVGLGPCWRRLWWTTDMVTTLCLAWPRSLCLYMILKERGGQWLFSNQSRLWAKKYCSRETGLCASMGGSWHIPLRTIDLQTKGARSSLLQCHRTVSWQQWCAQWTRTGKLGKQQCYGRRHHTFRTRRLDWHVPSMRLDNLCCGTPAGSEDI